MASLDISAAISSGTPTHPALRASYALVIGIKYLTLIQTFETLRMPTLYWRP